jgi:hypothetical protein
LLGKGVYFSTDPRVGSNQPHQYESTLSLSHPLNINQPDFRTNKNDIVRAALSLPKSASASDVTKHAMAMGYDGVVLDYKQTGYNQKEIAVFDTTAIKATRRLK